MTLSRLACSFSASLNLWKALIKMFPVKKMRHNILKTINTSCSSKPGKKLSSQLKTNKELIPKKTPLSSKTLLRIRSLVNRMTPASHLWPTSNNLWNIKELTVSKQKIKKTLNFNRFKVKTLRCRTKRKVRHLLTKSNQITTLISRVLSMNPRILMNLMMIKIHNQIYRTFSNNHKIILTMSTFTSRQSRSLTIPSTWSKNSWSRWFQYPKINKLRKHMTPQPFCYLTSSTFSEGNSLVMVETAQDFMTPMTMMPSASFGRTTLCPTKKSIVMN
jgi:hypothetical protein